MVEIISLNLDELEIEQLEQRLELGSLAIIGPNDFCADCNCKVFQGGCGINTCENHT